MSHALSVEEDGDSLRVRARARRSLVVSLFLGAWSVAWIASEIAGPARFIEPGADPTKFALIWWGLWTPLGLVALYAFLFSVAGWEHVQVVAGRLSLKRALFGVGRWRHYDAARIRNLRLYSRTVDINFKPPAVLGGGRLAFDYRMAVVRFVDVIADADAEALLQRIRAQLGPPIGAAH